MKVVGWEVGGGRSGWEVGGWEVGVGRSGGWEVGVGGQGGGPHLGPRQEQRGHA